MTSVVPTAEAFAPVAEIQHKMALITLALMVLSIPLLWLFSHRLLRPLGHLSRAMRAHAENMQAGVPTATVLETGSQEIRLVAAAFNDFLAARNAAEAAIKAKSEFLANNESRDPDTDECRHGHDRTVTDESAR